MAKETRKKGSIDLSTMVYGKVPPQAKELEEIIIGTCLIEKTAIDTLIELRLSPECFYVEAHQQIFHTMMDMQQRNVPIDIPILVEELKKKEILDLVGGPYAIVKMTNSVVSSANLETHCRIILQKFIQRELIRIAGEIIGDAYEDSTDVFDLLDDAESKIFSVVNTIENQNYYHVSQVQAKELNRFDKLRANDSHLSGVTSGFNNLDRITHGWQPTDLIILAARPSVGKTALALNFARQAATDPVKPIGVGFFSLEMSAGQLIKRIWSAESEINMDKLTTGQLADNEYSQLLRRGIQKVDSMPLWIDDTAALNIFQFRSKARKMVSKNKVGLIIIDYLQLMSGLKDKNGNREQEISTISRNLKALAKELNIPIIALSQLSRAVETRKESKIPQLSDLRESGAIEQDADMVAFIYRPEYYGTNANEQGESTGGLTEIKIAKHRNGILDTIRLRAILHYQKFEEWTSEINFSAPQLPSGNWKPFNEPKDDGDTPF